MDGSDEGRVATRAWAFYEHIVLRIDFEAGATVGLGRSMGERTEVGGARVGKEGKSCLIKERQGGSGRGGAGDGFIGREGRGGFGSL